MCQLIIEKTSLINLDLRSPLYYSVVNKLPLKFNESDDFLLFFELNPIQSQSIEPDREQLRGNLVFSGVKIENTRQPQDNLAPQTVILPAGKYLFTQIRNISSAESPLNFYTDWLDLAVEQQKDALWERNKLTNKLYVRYLFEDGKFVTQLFRTTKT
jgi:hypothetical protein